jgi:hypothetical protein
MAWPANVSQERGAILQTTTFAIADGKITALYMMRNPDRLTHVESGMTLNFNLDSSVQNG